MVAEVVLLASSDSHHGGQGIVHQSPRPWFRAELVINAGDIFGRK